MGEAAADHWWEEKRNVSEVPIQQQNPSKDICPVQITLNKTIFNLFKVLIHPNCDSATAPQYCVLALILAEPFNMQAKGRPR